MLTSDTVWFLGRQANGHARYQASSGSGRSGHSNEDDESSMTTEEGHGWFISWEDIRICRNAEGHKCRLGEGGFGIVYKALMNGVDEVAVKLVKADQPSAREMALFHKEVWHVGVPCNRSFDNQLCTDSLMKHCNLISLSKACSQSS